MYICVRKRACLCEKRGVWEREYGVYARVCASVCEKVCELCVSCVCTRDSKCVQERVVCRKCILASVYL